MRKWKPKFKIGQLVYAYIAEENIVVHTWVVSIHDDETYTLGERLLKTYNNVPEFYITKTIKKMCKKVLGKEYIYGKVLADYLENHLKENKDE